MTSYTYAVKGEQLLRSRGISVRVRRIENTSEGCGYSLIVPRDCRRAEAVLEAYKIPYKRVIRADGGA